ncbi:MAG: SRPBCC domain-containing protein [Myxococcota bacterium]
MTRTIVEEITVDAPLSDVWKAWTTNEGVRSFFASDSHIELREGGPYELYFAPDAAPGDRGSDGCEVLSFEPERRLVFSWNFPPSLPTIRNERTEAQVSLVPIGPRLTHVRFEHRKWQEGDDWNEGFAYFSKAWPLILQRLARRFSSGPMDWSDPYQLPELHHRVVEEVRALHEFFVAWFSGTTEKSPEVFNAGLPDRLAEDFALVQPAGDLLSRGHLLAAIESGYGNNPDFRIAIRNVVVRRTFDNHVLATYEEWQRAARSSTPPDNARVATALFSVTDDRLQWLHVHETWLPAHRISVDVFDF